MTQLDLRAPAQPHVPTECPDCHRIAGHPALDWNEHDLAWDDVCHGRGGSYCEAATKAYLRGFEAGKASR